MIIVTFISETHETAAAISDLIIHIKLLSELFKILKEKHFMLVSSTYQILLR